MNRPAISVALCTHNGQRYLAEQLESIARQTRLPDELIVCDDASSDATLGLIEQFATDCRFPVRLEVSCDRLGVTRNFDRAITLCSGEIIVLCDQDDVWYPNKLERLEKTLNRHPQAAFTFSDGDLLNDSGSLGTSSLWSFNPEIEKAIDGMFLRNPLAVLLRENVVTGAAMAFRAWLKAIVLPLPESWIHDYWIAILGSVFAGGIPVHDRLFAYRRHCGQSIGFNRDSWRQRLTHSSEAYRESCRNLEILLGRVRQVCGRDPATQQKIAMIEDAALHWRRRSETVFLGPFGRLRAVLAEAFTGRYHRFSNHWQSIVRDLLIPPPSADVYRC